MSRLANVIQEPRLYAKLQDFYQQCNFPIEVRYFLCTWFEEKEWGRMDPDDPSNSQTAANLLKDLLNVMRAKVQEMSGNLDLLTVRMRLEQTLLQFQSTYENDPSSFLRVIKQCMEKEEELFLAYQESLAGDMDTVPVETMEPADEVKRHRERVHGEIIAQLRHFNNKKNEMDQRYREMQNKQEGFILQYQENAQMRAQIANMQTQMGAIRRQLQAPDCPNKEKYLFHLNEMTNKEKALEAEKKRVETQLSEFGQQILNFRIEIMNSYNELIKEVQLMQKRILDEELIGWKRRQQLGGNGNPPEKEELDMLQHWCEQLAELIWGIRQQIKRLGILRAQLPIDLPPNVEDLLPELSDTITGMLSSLVTSTFIVEQQPPQVLKKEARFSTTVRLLVGGKLNVQMNPPQVRATIISENQAKNLLRSDMQAKQSISGTILNNMGTMDWQQNPGPHTSGCLSVHFRNMQLKTIKRSDKKGTEAVTEEKFCLLFQSDFNVGGNDLVFQVWTLSLPVVVTVHGNQECNAMATVLWDNAFSDPGRVPFVVPDTVPWPKLGEQLDSKFQQLTGRGLTQDSLDYLASKILNAPCSSDFSQSYVTWSQFNKEPLKDRTFTFWEWFYAVLKLTKEHLKGPWNDGYIIGFISKMKAQECLNRCVNGTFLLRYSDSEAGGITIAWIAESVNKPNEREVWNLAPYVAKDFVVRGLADRIHDLKNLTALYPDIRKEDAFSKYSTTPQESEQTSKNGYVPTHLVQVIGPQAMPIDSASIPARSPQHIPPSPMNPSSVPNMNTGDDLDFRMDGITDYLTTDYEVGDLGEYGVIDANQFVQNLMPFPPNN